LRINRLRDFARVIGMQKWEQFFTGNIRVVAVKKENGGFNFHLKAAVQSKDITICLPLCGFFISRMASICLANFIPTFL